MLLCADVQQVAAQTDLMTGRDPLSSDWTRTHEAERLIGLNVGCETVQLTSK